MHDVAVALDRELLGHFDRADFGDAADIVAAEIEQHQMFGALLLVGEQFGGQRLVLGLRLAAPARAGDRTDRDLARRARAREFPGSSRRPGTRRNRDSTGTARD